MSGIDSNSMKLLEKSMDFLWAKQTAILDNIANAETPYYKQKLVTFEEEFQRQLEQARKHARPAQALAEVLDNADWQVYDVQEIVRRDDNGVNVTEQSVELVRNAFQMQNVHRMISGEISLMRTAVNG